jgi:hypothetical protein
MYGLVNKAIQEKIEAAYGPETWKKIRLSVGFEEEEFIGLKAYPDDISYALVTAASAELGVPVDLLLELVGEEWISHTALNGYENVLNLAGNNMIDFIHNLDTIHNNITNLMPSMRPPKFRIKKESVTGMHLLYYSDRQGLQPMVIGILKGLGKRFGHEVSVKNLGPDPEYPDQILFDVNW